MYFSPQLGVLLLLGVITYVYTDDFCACKVAQRKMFHMETLLSLNWHAANAHCRRQNRSLASIMNRKEHEDMLAYVRPLYPEYSIGGIWIGGNNLAEPGIWRWTSTEEDITFFNWNEREPNNFGNKEHCIDQFGYNLVWNDNSCDSIRPFVCEYIMEEQSCTKTNISTYLVPLSSGSP